MADRVIGTHTPMNLKPDVIFNQAMSERKLVYTHYLRYLYHFRLSFKCVDFSLGCVSLLQMQIEIC